MNAHKNVTKSKLVFKNILVRNNIYIIYNEYNKTKKINSS
jgi:hypothetical protein